MKNIVNQLNKAFENRVRLGIMSILMANEEVAYKRLKELLDVTDGNLASHIKALEKLTYVDYTKVFIGKKPSTTYRVTKLGRQMFKKHINVLEKLISGQ